MRLFLFWPNKYSDLSIVIKNLEKAGHEIKYWVGNNGTKEPPREYPPYLGGTIFHDHYAAWEGVPAEDIDSLEFPPPGEELIESMLRAQSIALVMMNKRFDTFGIDQRLSLYYKMLGYWHGVITKFKPEAIIFSTVPHTVYNYIVYELARNLGIKTIMFEDSWVTDRLLMYNDWREGSKKLLEELEKNKSKNFSVNDLSPDIKEYYLKQTDPNHDSTPVYTSFYKSENKGSVVIKKKIKVVIQSIKEKKFFARIIPFIVRRFKADLKKEYNKFTVKPDFSKNFIYIPLSFQPERTSSPQADFFVNQLLMIETVSSALPDDWVIYVKEHPTQWLLRGGTRYFSARYAGYYERIYQISKTHLVSIETSTYDLINSCRALAATSGTAGWEAILRSKPMLNFGYPWYRDCPEAFRVFDTNSCRSAIEKIKKGYIVNQQNVINFLKSFDDATTHGYLEKFIKSSLSKEENKATMAESIVSDLEKK